MHRSYGAYACCTLRSTELCRMCGACSRFSVRCSSQARGDTATSGVGHGGLCDSLAGSKKREATSPPRPALTFSLDATCVASSVVIDPGTISPSGTSFAVRALSVLCCGGSSQAQRARDGESAVRRTTRAERIKSGVQVFTCKCDVFRWLGDL